MNTGTHITLALSSAVLPIAVAANMIPTPGAQGVPPILVLLIAALGPSCVGVLHLLGKTLLLSLSGYFLARSKGKKELAAKLLADKDKSNDVEAEKLLLSAVAEEGAAKALEQAALKVKG